MKTKPITTVKFVTLGCSKNLVDSESLMAQFKSHQIEIIQEESSKHADIVVINTCGFIHDAKEESIDTILAYIKEKELGHVDNVLVMGCLSERYKESLEGEIPELGGIFGVNDHQKIMETVGLQYKKELVGERILTTPSHYAYLKISEGCDRTCSFCAIPLIRGKHKSKPIEDILTEAEQLAGKGVKELILIAQDLTYYGLDLYGERKLPELVNKLCALEHIQWIRLHYLYPANFPVELLEVMQSQPKVCNYIDLPFQHVNTRLLKSMKRSVTGGQTKKLIQKIRDDYPEAALRTTVIVGYPGETDQEFDELIGFVKENRFERLGVFTYSHEENTPAHKLEDDVPESKKRARAAELMQVQEEISWYHNQDKKGKTFKVLIDSIEGDYYVGRTEFDSPEVDNEVLIKRKKGDKQKAGEFYNVKITWWENFDLFGEFV